MSASPQISGDFLSLLATHNLAPLRVDATHAAPVETQATTVFAFHFADGVLMVRDPETKEFRRLVKGEEAF